MVYDDSAFNDGFTLTDSYSVYPNAFNSYSNDGRYTKHIYIGSERIASQLSTSFPAQGNVAGYNVGIRVDYANKRDLMNAQIDSAYTAFGLVYKGINHDVDNYYPFDNPNYWNNAHHAPAVDDEQAEQAPFNSQRDMVYYYHKDHLGSSAFITNDSACVVQQIEYLPYGEVFLEKQRYTSDYQTPYRFNGKELDEETGLYYYGARYMNPRLSIWYGCDPLQEYYANVASYSYCMGNPIYFTDLRGDSLYVAPSYRELFNRAITDVFGENISKGFVYNNRGMLEYHGDVRAMSKEQRQIYKDFNKVMASKTITAIIYEETYNAFDMYGNAATIIPHNSGGEGTLLACENENFKQNYIVIDPFSPQEISILRVTDAYYETYGTVPTPNSKPNFSNETIKTNVSNLTWHGIGHVIFGGKSQDKVLDFDNKTRKLMNLSRRPYDQTHNRKVTNNVFGNVWGF